MPRNGLDVSGSVLYGLKDPLEVEPRHTSRTDLNWEMEAAVGALLRLRFHKFNSKITRRKLVYGHFALF